MSVQKHYSLGKLNSLQLESTAEQYVHVTAVDQLAFASDFSGPLHYLGGGSNVLLLPSVTGRVLHIGIQGISARKDVEGSYRVRVGAGENWHSFVLHTLNAGISGLENLILIPGNVGSAPYQNIGAYGRELSDLVHSVEVFNRNTKAVHTLTNDECRFSYRNSIFRANSPSPLIITHVNFCLGKHPLETSYRDVRESLKNYSEQDITYQLVAEHVMNIRQSKLPTLDEFPNVGSFFKNPTLELREYDRLRGEIDVIGFPHEDQIRVPAARLIDARKWKGRVVDNVLIWHQQPLVLVNTGRASASDFLNVASRIADDVHQRYEVKLELEPVVVGNES